MACVSVRYIVFNGMSGPYVLSTVSNISKSFGINQKLDLTYVTHMTTIKGHCHPGLDIVDL